MTRLVIYLSPTERISKLGLSESACVGCGGGGLCEPTKPCTPCSRARSTAWRRRWSAASTCSSGPAAWSKSPLGTARGQLLRPSQGAPGSAGWLGVPRGETSSLDPLGTARASRLQGRSSPPPLTLQVGRQPHRRLAHATLGQAERHGGSAPLAVPHLGSCASSGRTWRLWAVRHFFQEEAEPPRADCTTFRQSRQSKEAAFHLELSRDPRGRGARGGASPGAAALASEDSAVQSGAAGSSTVPSSSSSSLTPGGSTSTASSEWAWREVPDLP